MLLMPSRLLCQKSFCEGPPLLAIQGTADPPNAPAITAAYFSVAHRPKFLLWLVGASHRPPYTDEQRELGIVERTAITFLNRYLEGQPEGLRRSSGRLVSRD